MAGAPPLRWGVIGATAQVAVKAVLPAIAASPHARLVATASLSEPGPAVLVLDPGVRRYRAYDDLLADRDIDAVYVPLPNSLHRPWVERVVAAGKHVLCEKPLAPSAGDARAMAAASERAGVTLLEAYMTPFHPRAAAVEELVGSGRLGALRFARAAFTAALDRPADHRWRPEMGGGALLDVGTYCVAPLLAMAGHLPARAEATASWSATGVDASLAGWLDFGGGFAAAVECSFEAPERQLLEVVGTDGALTVDRAFTPGAGDVAFTLRRRDGRCEAVVAGGADPYRAMIEDFQAVVAGRARPRHSLARSIATLEALDRLREAAERSRPAAGSPVPLSRHQDEPRDRSARGDAGPAPETGGRRLR